ncbi:MAG: acetoin utilization protein AcuC [Frankiaceae bacterium]
MSESVLVLWDDAMLRYDLGPTHPMRPVRLELTVALARGLGLLDQACARVVAPAPAGDATLELVHEPDYVAAVRRAPHDVMARLGLRYGIGTPDTPVFAGMHDATALAVGASVQGAQAVWDGSAGHAVNIAGGLHHAMRSSASGFCVYNDAAIAIARLLELGARRVAYVDVDVHHGDGVQAAFYGDPRVLTISLHQSGRTLFPGTGFPTETGDGEAHGTAVNVALPPGTGDDEWLRAFHAVVPGLLRAFRPEVLVSQHGCDTHAEDPLADLRLSVDGQRATAAAVHELAHEVTGGRWLALGGGGYSLCRVVPRTWTHLIAVATGAELDPSTPTPEAWRELALRRTGEAPPPAMTDEARPRWTPWHPGDAEDAVDRSILATRRAVYPLHGLDPLDPRD